MEAEVNKSFRECGMLITVAAQGGGKTHQNKLLICEYVKDKISTKVKGRKALMLDTNGEYSTDTFGINGIPPLAVKRLSVKDVGAWCRSPIIEARRIDMKSLAIAEKLKILEYVSQQARNCLLVMEDINTIILDMTHEKAIISNIVNLRHKAVDVIVSYQSLRAVEPRILSNCRYVRMHYMIGSVDDVKGKLSEPEVFKIAQNIVNTKYFKGDKRAFVYVHTNPHKITGKFNKADFDDACKKYLATNRKRYKDEQEIRQCSVEEALKSVSEQIYGQFYGNPKTEVKA